MIRDKRENDWNAWFLPFWVEVVDELGIGSKEGGHCNGGTKNYL